LKALRAALRGGNFNNGANAGVFAANLNNAPSNANYNIGFRAAKTNLPPDRPGGDSRPQSRFSLEPRSLPKGKT
jgi:hypothetical protein